MKFSFAITRDLLTTRFIVYNFKRELFAENELQLNLLARLSVRVTIDRCIFFELSHISKLIPYVRLGRVGGPMVVQVHN